MDMEPQLVCFSSFFVFFLTPPKSQTNKQAGMACI